MDRGRHGDARPGPFDCNRTTRHQGQATRREAPIAGEERPASACRVFQAVPEWHHGQRRIPRRMTLLEHRKRRPPLLSLTMALVIALPTAAALLFAYRESLGGFQEIAALMTRQVVLRTDAVGIQMRRGLATLAPLKQGDPCTPAGIALMRETLLRSDMLADVGYVRDGRLRCSSFGPQDRPLGQPGFMSRNGYWLRRGVRLHDAMDTTLVAATDPASGLTLFTHENAVLNIIPTDQPWQVAVIGHGVTDTVLAQRGDFDPRWLGRVDSGDSGFFVQAGHLVAWEHSRIGAYTVFAALPYGTWEKSWIKASLLLGGIGLALGVFLASLMARSIKRSSSLRAQLRRALKGNELFLEYQPVVELASGRWVGAEALMRWRRPTGELIGPGIFVPIAEKNGMAPELRNRLIQLLERDAAPLFARHPAFHLALNFSARRPGRPRRHPGAPAAGPATSSSRSPRWCAWTRTTPAPPSMPCTRPASASPSTISAPAIPACRTLPSSASTT